MQLAEESTSYKLNQLQTNDSQDELIKNILQDKKEVTGFINQFIEPREEIKEEELIRYPNHFITKKYKSKEIDLVYKLKTQDVFFLIEHQDIIDNSMPYRMLNYCLDIMQEWNRNKKTKNNIRYPIIVPIVIYTGKQKWKMPRNFREKQISNYIWERYNINLEYNCIDINKISKQFLLQKDTLFGYIMFIEKSENYEDLAKNLDIIMKTTKDKGMIEKLVNIISYLLDYTLQDRIKRKVDKKDMNNMNDLINRLVTQSSRDIQRGKETIRKEIVEKMLDKEIDEKIIIETTGINEEQLEKIKKELAIAS